MIGRWDPDVGMRTNVNISQVPHGLVHDFSYQKERCRVDIRSTFTSDIWWWEKKKCWDAQMSNCLLTYVCCTFISSSYWNTKSEFPKTSTAKTLEKNHVKKCFKKSLGTAWGRANGSALPTSCGRGFHSRSGSFGLASETKYTTQAHFLLPMDLNSHFCTLIGEQQVGNQPQHFKWSGDSRT